MNPVAGAQAQVRPTDDGIGPAHLGDRPREQELSALTVAVTKLVTDNGRSPTGATSWALDDHYVVTALEGFLTPAEHECVGMGLPDVVRDLHYAVAEAIAHEYRHAAECALERTVIAHRSELICASNICLEIFSLARSSDARG